MYHQYINLYSNQKFQSNIRFSSSNNLKQIKLMVDITYQSKNTCRAYEINQHQKLRILDCRTVFLTWRVWDHVQHARVNGDMGTSLYDVNKTFNEYSTYLHVLNWYLSSGVLFNLTLQIWKWLQNVTWLINDI